MQSKTAKAFPGDLSHGIVVREDSTMLGTASRKGHDRGAANNGVRQNYPQTIPAPRPLTPEVLPFAQQSPTQGSDYILYAAGSLPQLLWVGLCSLLSDFTRQSSLFFTLPTVTTTKHFMICICVCMA